MNPPAPSFRRSVGRTGRVEPRSARNEDVEPAVVVIIGLIADEPTELVGDSRRLAAILERAVAAVSIERHAARVGSKAVTTMSRSPSPSKSSMIAPPDWLNRSSPASWLLSRNSPMSNSEWKKRSTAR